MAARRAVQAKTALASNSNLSQSGTLQAAQKYNNNKSAVARMKSTSMTNLMSTNNDQANDLGNQNLARSIQRPASRNALDSIHKGMNAKFTHVQSKVLLQNIRPNNAKTDQQQQQHQQNGSKIPAVSSTTTPNSTLRHARGKTLTPTTIGQSGKIQQSDRSQLINKIKTLQEELAKLEQINEELRRELEREKNDKIEQVQQIKLEIQDKCQENERQNEEYHQKLLEAYELADQNRRAADSVLSESRQREEELRKKIEDLEQQLSELKEFVSMKEEMVSKMAELREQIRVERERYEEKTRTLNQMFESEKIRAKPSLQSVESINRLDLGHHHDQVLDAANSNNKQRQQNARLHLHQSEHDIYGSKLSTRMQDGAKFAWKKSRKFASSVITGSLGGLSACRKRSGASDQCQAAGEQRDRFATGSHSSSSVFAPAAVVVATNPIGVELNTNSSDPSRANDGVDIEPVTKQDSELHTSVVEVGEQQAGSGALNQSEHEQQQGTPSTTKVPATLVMAPGYAHQEQRQNEQQSLIRVDENNKLTIVTKFNVNDAAECHQQPAASSSSVSAAGSERSRCESSSSGRGTASDSGSGAGSQNGDSPDQLEGASPRSDRRVQDDELAAVGNESYQRHKRKSSLFKASNVFSGSQASLNKTFKSFFALAAASSASKGNESDKQNASSGGENLMRVRQHRSFDQTAAVPFDLASTTTFKQPPALESFKQMGELMTTRARNTSDQVDHERGEPPNNNNQVDHEQMANKDDEFKGVETTRSRPTAIEAQ